MSLVDIIVVPQVKKLCVIALSALSWNISLHKTSNMFLILSTIVCSQPQWICSTSLTWSGQLFGGWPVQWYKQVKSILCQLGFWLQPNCSHSMLFNFSLYMIYFVLTHAQYTNTYYQWPWDQRHPGSWGVMAMTFTILTHCVHSPNISVSLHWQFMIILHRDMPSAFLGFVWGQYSISNSHPKRYFCSDRKGTLQVIPSVCYTIISSSKYALISNHPLNSILYLWHHCTRQWPDRWYLCRLRTSPPLWDIPSLVGHTECFSNFYNAFSQMFFIVLPTTLA